jgi:hypothetical protein
MSHIDVWSSPHRTGHRRSTITLDKSFDVHSTGGTKPVHGFAGNADLIESIVYVTER